MPIGKAGVILDEELPTAQSCAPVDLQLISYCNFK